MRALLSLLILIAGTWHANAVGVGREGRSIGALGVVSKGGGGAGATPTTFDPATLSNATLDASKLTVTRTSTSTGGAQSTSYKITGKYCITYVINSSTANTDFIGVQDSTTGYPAETNGSPGNYAGYWIKNNQILRSGGSQGALQAAPVAGNSINMAVDATNGLCWYQLANPTPGLWNNDASANPATGTNGKVCFSNVAPVVAFSAIGSPTVGDNITAKFDSSACGGQLPSGYTAGWPR